MSSGGGGGSIGGGGYSSGGSAADPDHPERSITKGDTTYTWSWRRFGGTKDQQLTDGQKACESLLDELERPNPDPTALAAKVRLVQEIRQRAAAALAEAQQRLRATTTEEQQAVLALMGYLD